LQQRLGAYISDRLAYWGMLVLHLRLDIH
jgi:hypothetical protein